MNTELKQDTNIGSKQAYAVGEIAAILDISERSAYNLCNNTTDFKVLRLGRTIRVNKQSFDSWFTPGLSLK